MSRTDAYRLVKMIGAGVITYIGFLATHNTRQATGGENLLIPEFWLVQMEAIAAGLGAVGLYMSTPPQIGTKQETP